jgi:hypothetical protein
MTACSGYGSPHLAWAVGIIALQGRLAAGTMAGPPLVLQQWLEHLLRPQAEGMRTHPGATAAKQDSAHSPIARSTCSLSAKRQPSHLGLLVLGVARKAIHGREFILVPPTRRRDLDRTRWLK